MSKTISVTSSLEEAINDVISNNNISKPYKTAREAVEAILED